ncbi:hypothetical protein ACJIZ3_009645 [Penstemon smallii]|uniref:Uncharacterized protein n=1 Tax=Penstemon smallii TaxID=265156 RepID=A0ABD3TD39_9LAMI
MGRSPCCSKVGLRRGPWSTKEDTTLTNFIQQNGEGQWRSLPKNAGLLRCGKSCRLRWMNYLRPGIKRGNISQDEEDLIVRLHRLLGNRWSLIAGRLPGRTDNEIKNYWNTHLIKKLKESGINPKPHKHNLPKKKKKQKKVAAATTTAKKTSTKKIEEKKLISNNDNNNNNNNDDVPKTKVYLPKPIRVSSAFSRTNSYDSLTTGTSSSEGGEAAAEVVSYVPVAWLPEFELEDANYGLVGGGAEDDFLGVGCIFSSDENMWDKVYDEYLQLL